MLLAIISWIVIGLIVGFIGSKVVNLRGDDVRLGLGATVAGAIVGGLVSSMITTAGVTAFNPWGLLWSAIGGVVAVVTWHLVRSRYISHESYVPRHSY